MSDRDKKLLAILAYAEALVASGTTNTSTTAYRGGRGIARLVDASYAYVRDELGLGDAGASPIAEAFTNRWGAYAYE